MRISSYYLKATIPPKNYTFRKRANDNVRNNEKWVLLGRCSKRCSYNTRIPKSIFYHSLHTRSSFKNDACMWNLARQDNTLLARVLALDPIEEIQLCRIKLIDLTSSCMKRLYLLIRKMRKTQEMGKNVTYSLSRI